jgi:hypothetical protein
MIFFEDWDARPKEGSMQTPHQWWCEGELGAQQVYRQSYGGFMAAAAASAAVILFLPAFRTWYVLIIFLGITTRALVERRRAFIFTDSAVVYRPAFGRGVRVEAGDVLYVENTTAAVPFSFRTRLLKGLRIRLRNNKDIVLPLDFPDPDAISGHVLKRLGHSCQRFVDAPDELRR